jgi:uroporphyrinogen III methyltransferase/synthase
VVGDVVTLRETINWFETRPLYGARIVVTRARDQASDLKRLFEESGAEVLQFPTIQIEPPASWDSLDRAVTGTYDWLVFTSVHGVSAFFDRLTEHGRDARSLHGRKIAAVGRVTADALRSHGIQPDVMPERFISSELLPLLAEDQRGIRTTVIRAEEGSEELIEELRRRGGDVDLAIAYRNVPAEMDLEALRDLIRRDAIDVVTFTSASTVDRFFQPLSDDERARVIEHAALASIGAATTEAVRRYGKDPDIVAANATIQALHDAVVEHRRR